MNYELKLSKLGRQMQSRYGQNSKTINNFFAAR